MSLGDLVLGPAYTAFGQDATLSVAGIDYQIRAIERSTGMGLDSGGLSIETLAPTAAIRCADLAALGLVKSDIEQALLTLGGNDWHVTSARPLPSPGGEGDGEYLLLLEAV